MNVRLVAGDPNDVLGAAVVRLEVVVGHRPVRDGRVLRQGRRAPLVADEGVVGELVRVHPAYGATPSDHRPADAVEHPAEREGRGNRRGVGVATPAGGLLLELVAHVAPGVVRGVELVGHEVVLVPPGTGLEADHPQPAPGEHRSDEPTDRTHADEDDVDVVERVDGDVLRVEPVDLDGIPDRPVEPVSGVGERADVAPLVHGLLREVLRRGVREVDAGMAEQAPSGLVQVAAVRGIAEDPFLRGGEQHVEEGRGRRDPEVGKPTRLHGGQQLVLPRWSRLGEGDPEPCARRLVQGAEPQLVGVAQAAKRPGQGLVEVVDRSHGRRGRPVLVGGQEPVKGGPDRARLVGRQGQQPPVHAPVSLRGLECHVSLPFSGSPRFQISQHLCTQQPVSGAPSQVRRRAAPGPPGSAAPPSHLAR
jgi:hypothetical protein